MAATSFASWPVSSQGASVGLFPVAAPITSSPKPWKVCDFTFSMSGTSFSCCETRSPSSLAVSRLKARSRICSGLASPSCNAYPVLATIVDVLPEPAAATMSTLSSMQMQAWLCSSVNGFFSTLSKNALCDTILSR